MNNQTEYQLLSQNIYESQGVALFTFLASAFNNNKYNHLDYDIIINDCNLILNYFRISKKYYILYKLNNNLKFTSDGFYISHHRFETLDEVERAFNNPAFL